MGISFSQFRGLLRRRPAYTALDVPITALVPLGYV